MTVDLVDRFFGPDSSLARTAKAAPDQLGSLAWGDLDIEAGRIGDPALVALVNSRDVEGILAYGKTHSRVVDDNAGIPGYDGYTPLAQPVPSESGLSTVKQEVMSALSGINPLVALAGGGVAVLGAAAVGVAIAKRRKKKRTGKGRKASHRRRSGGGRAKRSSPRRSRLKFGSPAWRKKYMKRRKHKVGTAKQYRRKGGKAVKYTKKGQPYIILNNGKARFVKK